MADEIFGREVANSTSGSEEMPGYTIFLSPCHHSFHSPCYHPVYPTPCSGWMKIMAIDISSLSPISQESVHIGAWKRRGSFCCCWITQRSNSRWFLRAESLDCVAAFDKPSRCEILLTDWDIPFAWQYSSEVEVRQTRTIIMPQPRNLAETLAACFVHFS